MLQNGTVRITHTTHCARIVGSPPIWRISISCPTATVRADPALEDRTGGGWRCVVSITYQRSALKNMAHGGGDSSHRIGERIQGVADQSEYVLDPYLFERADQDLSNCLGQGILLIAVTERIRPWPCRMQTRQSTFRPRRSRCLLLYRKGAAGVASTHPRDSLGRQPLRQWW